MNNNLPIPLTVLNAATDELILRAAEHYKRIKQTKVTVTKENVSVSYQSMPFASNHELYLSLFKVSLDCSQIGPTNFVSVWTSKGQQIKL